MKQIGILTFHKAYNYGAALQVYALSRFLRDSGYDVEVIDYLSERHLRNVQRYKKPVNRGALEEDLLNMRYGAFLTSRNDDFHMFAEKYLPLSKNRNITSAQFPGAVNAYDAVICGSDQIWNPRLPDADTDYFLPFDSTARKIAYGISLGNGYPGEYERPEMIRKAVLDFDFLSFREEAAITRMTHFCDLKRMPEITCDPSMLLRAEVYEELAGEKQQKEPYIFVYALGGRKRTIEAAERLSRARNIPYWGMLSGPPKAYWKALHGHLMKGEQGPQDFLRMIRDAEYVVTDSFHGAVFSILFGKKFSLILREDERGNIIRDERLAQLTKIFRLEDHCVRAKDILNASFTELDKEQIETIRQTYAYTSADYLHRALAGEDNPEHRDLLFEQGMICPSDLCTSCYACRNICPADAVELYPAEDGRLLPRINAERCLHCRKCTDVCQARTLVQRYPVRHTYAAQWLNQEEAISSSTSGLAYLLSERFAQKNGYVYGAGIDHDLCVRHYGTDDPFELEGMRTSKYAQSDMGYICRDVQKKLKEGRQVLFTGTPCQIAGLRQYLGREYDGLYCLDLVCHGAPPMSYLHDHLMTFDQDYDTYSFRGGKKDKQFSLWKDGRTVHSAPNWQDRYYFAYEANMIMAENCYSCPYADTKRVGDITLGDFWGIDRRSLKEPMTGRIALVLVNTGKGEELLEMIREDLLCEERDIRDALPKNPNLTAPTKAAVIRRSFMDEYRKTQNFETAFERSKAAERHKKVIFRHTPVGKILWKIKKKLK